ncbi:hypothetical protein FRX31_012509 [Thalictrum thalictroides]|uniref:Uncharacterized protein n=1 Tax=Thalictrum thalictroides TaxID=46969 RepID=A0A7J6WLP5_THATH|nr:hypothetical protein FRX31_012509 [Thalictrum thalictroides]
MCGSYMHALRHNVEAIDIRNWSWSVADLTTPHIFISEALKVLKVQTFSIIHLPSSICLPSLRILHFESVTINGHIDKAFFSAMPSLKTFIVENCRLSKHESITISACQLETLIITGSLFRMPITIFSGRLKSLDIEVAVAKLNLKFKGKFSYLSDAKFDIL